MTHDDHVKESAMMPPYEMPAGDGEPPQEGATVRAGAPKDPNIPAATEEAVVEAVRAVYDPEIPVNIYDLGLIYELNVAGNGDVAIVMTLTAPACPVAGSLPKEVAERVSATEGVGEVSVAITWDPPWTPANMSEVAKVALDMF
jgi:FeS assembly SUF system protein